MVSDEAGSFFSLLIRTLPTFWAEQICILRIFIFWIRWVSKFPDFQIPGFPDSRLSAVAGSPRGTKSGKSQELGQDRENPSSVNAVGGITENLFLALAASWATELQQWFLTMHLIPGLSLIHI